MGYYLTWPSDLGPCVTEVSESFFRRCLRADKHAMRDGDVLRYPPPSWVRVVSVSVPVIESNSLPLFSAVGAGVIVAFALVYAASPTAAVAPAKPVQYVRVPLLV